MYNFDFLKNEELIEIFEDVWIVQGNNEKCMTIALTNQRLLFLDYDKFDPREDLRIGRGVDYLRAKEVYYSIDLKNIKNIIDYNNNYYSINFRDDSKSIDFDDKQLFKLLKYEIEEKNSRI